MRAAVVVAAIAVLAASCGGTPRTVLVPSPQPPITPGHDSPQAAVAGYLTGYRNKDGKMICEYVPPAQGGLCQFLVGESPDDTLAPWRIGNSLVRGSEAIVVVLSDRWCIAKLCLRNNDPSKGLPRKKRDFPHVFDATSNSLPAVSVVRLGGKWYVAIG